MIKEAIEKLIQGKDLYGEEMALAMEEIMTAQATAEQTAAFLTSLRLKGETVEEITAAATIMRKFATPIKTDQEVVVDTCGTGGDCSGTFNVSTVAAFVVAAAGVAVAKHGNRSVSSKCGSADLLEGMGVNINLPPALIETCLKKVGMAFLFAPQLHPLMKQVASIRKELGFRTIFNILGPLANPARVNRQVLGVFDKKLVKKLAQVLKGLGVRHALVVHGRDGLDEITTTASTDICEVKNDKLSCFALNPRLLGIKITKSADLKADNIAENIRIAEEVLKGTKGPHRDIVVLNAAAAIYVGDKSKNIKEGIKIAQEAIDSGKAAEKLRDLREFSKRGG